VTISPTALTLRALRRDGYTAQVVEHWVPGANVRRDLFGIVDVLAIRGEETLGVQATSDSNVSARVRKIAESEHIAAIREAGWAVRVDGWSKKDGKWVCRSVDCS
jgi:hypothetical protein